MTTMARFFFCHLQKTAGTSLLVRLKRHFGDDRVYPSRSDGHPVARVISVPHLLKQWQARGSEIQVVTGHFPLCVASLLGAEFVTFTILREPVARTLSFLRHRRRLPAERGKTLEQIYGEHAVFDTLIQNHMVKMLSLTADEMSEGARTRVGYGRERLARAIEQLACIDVVGITEEFDEFCATLAGRYDLHLGEPVRINRTPSFDVSPSFRDRILADNALDAELYAAATRLVASRVQSTGGSSRARTITGGGPGG